MIRSIMFPRIGWFILHAVAISATFIIGYSIRFGYG